MSAVHSTELGELPGTWRVQRFDSLFAVQQGRQVSKKNRVGENQRPFLRTKNVFWGRLDLSELDEMHFSESDEERLTLISGDLLICEGGDIGRTGIWRGELASVLNAFCEKEEVHQRKHTALTDLFRTLLHQKIMTAQIRVKEIDM